MNYDVVECASSNETAAFLGTGLLWLNAISDSCYWF